MKTSALGALLLTSLLLAQEDPTAAAMDAAAARYRELGLPEPAASDPLVLLAGFGGGPGPRGGDVLTPAFRRVPGAEGPRYLIGTGISTRPVRVVAEEPFRQPLDAETLVASDWNDDAQRDQELAVGLQLWGRGQAEVARRLVQRRGPAETMLDRIAVLAAAHWRAQVHESTLPLGEVERRLRAAAALLPGARPAADGEPAGLPAPWDQILDQLARAAAAPVPPPDPLTALVLGLVHSRRAGGLMAVPDDTDAAFHAVVVQGFAIVPVLLAHLDDDRLTRARTTGFNNFRSYGRPLSELVGEALQAIAGNVIPSAGLPAPRVRRADAEAWWADVRGRSEDEYLLERFAGDPDGAANASSMRILAAKYPERLELALLELVQRHPERVGHAIVDTIADGSMRTAKKIELLERIAATNRVQRLAALRRLAGVDEERFCARFLEVLAGVSRTTPPEVWTSPDGSLGHLVVLTRRPEVWLAFLRTAREAQIGLRMEWLGMFSYDYLGDRQRRERLACLAAFLDDEEVYDVKASGQDGPHAAFTFERLAMRDFAALRLASLLGFAQGGAPQWTAEQWAALRAKVRKALQDSGIQPMR